MGETAAPFSYLVESTMSTHDLVEVGRPERDRLAFVSG